MNPIENSEVFSQDPEMGVTELDDGSALIDMPMAPEQPEVDFYSNLAETLSSHTLNKLSAELLELIEKDKEARKKRDEQYEEGIKRTGLGDDAPGGANFDGASRVVHPVLAEGCVDYAARAIREIFPANGPVRTKIIGEADTQKLDKAKRKRDFLNWQLTNQILEYRPEKESLLTQLPLGGSQYEKYWYDVRLGRIRMEFVPIDKVLLPFATTSFYSTPRMTHIQELTEEGLEERINSGFYLPINEAAPDDIEETAAQKANDRIEGRTADGNPDGLRIVYEISYAADIEAEDDYAPYVVHLDEHTGKIVAIYRNWAPNDELKLKLDWWVENKFIPWRGAYGIGLPHLIGGMAAALTGALRALLDSAHINNSPGAVKLKGGRTSGANTQIAQTEVKEIDAPAGTDDIRKVIMPMPFNPPSTVLFQLLDWLTGQAKGVVATTEERMDQVGDRTPVGTTMAMIEQGSATYSAIHARLHESQKRALQIICRLNASYPPKELQRYGLTPEDFLDTDDIEPVSDPHIFSEAQRYAQLQEQVKLVQLFPQLPWNFNELARRALQLLRVDGIDAILPKQPEPVTADPVSENVAAMTGAPLKAAPPQDHLAHIMTHVGFIVNPTHQMTPGPAPGLGTILKHVEEHMLLFYQVTVQAALVNVAQQAMASGEQASQDQLLMRAAQQAQQLMANLLQDVAPMMQQAGQIVQAKMPQPPVDPAIQKTFEAAMAEVNRKKEEGMARLQLDQQKLQAEAQAQQIQAQLDERLAMVEGQSKAHLEVVRMQFEKQAEELRQQVEVMKNDADNRQHQMTELLKNRDDNQTQLLIAQMKEELAAMAPKEVEQPREDDAMLKQLQQMLGELEKSRTSDALATVTEGLKSLIASQQDHQKRTMEMAAQLMRGE